MAAAFEIDQNLAKNLFESGSTCICLGVTKGTEFGIDMKSWTINEKFLGFKMIPPGFHYIHYRMANTHGDTAPTVGFIWITKQSEIMVKKWNEELAKFESKMDEADQIKGSLKDIDKYLGPYPYEVWDKWKNLTTNITEEIAKKIVPDIGFISAVLELNGITDSERKDGSSQQKKRKRCSQPFSDLPTYGDLLPELHAAAGTELRFSKFPELCYPTGASPSEITKHSLDSSYLMEQILLQHTRPADIIGELQFAFVSFLVGHSMEGFEQWKRLLGMFCSVQDSLSKYTPIFSELLTILKAQLDEILEDFLVDIVESSNFVYQSLRKLFRNISTEGNEIRLKTKAQRFASSLTDKFSWDFSGLNDEEEDELPVIVS